MLIEEGRLIEVPTPGATGIGRNPGGGTFHAAASSSDARPDGRIGHPASGPCAASAAGSGSARAVRCRRWRAGCA